MAPLPRIPKELITIRAARKDVEAVRAIAAREGESQSTILRRMLRVGLATTERRTVHQANE